MKFLTDNWFKLLILVILFFTLSLGDKFYNLQWLEWCNSSEGGLSKPRLSQISYGYKTVLDKCTSLK